MYPGGTRELSGLPTRGLVLLKVIILSQFPQYWKCLHVFEGIWKKCWDSIKQACKRERKNVLLQLVPKDLNMFSSTGIGFSYYADRHQHCDSEFQSERIPVQYAMDCSQVILQGFSTN